jgi:hypothetical protein
MRNEATALNLSLIKYKLKTFLYYLSVVRLQYHISDREQRFQQSTKLTRTVSFP